MVIKWPDGTLKSTAFHIRFGTLKVLDSEDVLINIRINDVPIPNIYMHLLPEGAAYFLEKNEDNTKLTKKLRPSNSTLQLFNLRKGYNKIEFIINTELQGSHIIEGKIYLYNYDTKLVISDVDGTVTKSDIKGHLYTVLGKQWTHDDIAQLYTTIQKNGYKMVYLSSRPLTLYNYTQKYLQEVNQNGFRLPDGPTLLSPDLFLSSINREAIFKKADEFKSALLKDIQCIFPLGTNPIYSGFGNRDTDAVAYLYSGVPVENIYIINEKGEVENIGKRQILSYKKIFLNCKELFPPIRKNKY